MSHEPNSELNFSEGFESESGVLDFGAGSDSVPGKVSDLKIDLGLSVDVDLSYNQKNSDVEFSIGLSFDSDSSYNSGTFTGLISEVNHDNQYAKMVSRRQSFSSGLSKPISKEYDFDNQFAKFVYDRFFTFSGLSRQIRSEKVSKVEFAKFLGSGIGFISQYMIFLNRDIYIKNEHGKLLSNYTNFRSERMIRLIKPLISDHEYAKIISKSYFSDVNYSQMLVNRYNSISEFAKFIPQCYRIIPEEPVDNNFYGESELNFICEWEKENTTLNFGVICQPQDEVEPVVIVPGVIFVTNFVDLVRSDTGDQIQIFTFNVGIDEDSYCWSFDAQVAFKDLDKVDITKEKDINVDLSINGNKLRFILDRCDDSSIFGKNTLNISGKSRSIMLAHPYQKHRGHIYDQSQPIVQIVNSEMQRLPENPFTLDWDLISDLGWQVPRYSYTNKTIMNALVDIAEAAGGFVTCDPFQDIIKIKSRYPVASWQLKDATPSKVIPSALVFKRSRTRIEKPEYNGVLVSGTTTNGLMRLVKRSGTDGSNRMNQVSHQLITDQSVARHRGIVELSRTGDMGNINLTMPLHPDIGILTPGEITRVSDGTEWNGIVRSTQISGSVDVQKGIIIRQTTDVERHWDKE